MSLRVSVTTLESFRRLLQTEYGSEEELIAQIMGKPFEPTWQMRAGTAWHACLEKHPRTGAYALCTSGGFSFSALHVCEALGHIGPGIWEVKAARVFDIGWHHANVVAQTDHCRGLLIQDNKTKFSPADARDYEASLQWRFYLAIHGAPRLRYNLFSFKDPDEQGYCELKDILSFSFWDYAGLESDCRFWLTEFLLWAGSKNLLSYLNREGSSPTVEAAEAVKAL